MYISSVDDGIVQFYSEPIVQSFLKVCLTIDTVIYNLISWLYSVFMTIAKARVFTAETVRPFLDRIYLVVGIVALFFAAYTFMSIIVNPENLTKGNSSPAKMIRNIILGILSITLIPTIFNFAYSVQGAALDQNVIGKLFISGSDKLMDDSENNLNSFGVTLFEASFYVKPNSAADAKTIESTKELYKNAHNYAMLYNDVSLYGSCLTGVQGGTIQYNFILAGVIGIIVCYIFFVYCFDLGLRAIKLAFLQIISPLPCLLLMVPGQDKVFKSWLKDTLKTFFEVFMKIFIVVFCVYIIQLLREWFDVNQAQVFPGVSLAVVNFAKIFIFLGVIMFMKKAPKLIEDLFGIKTDPKSFSLKQKLVDSGIAGFADKTFGTVGGMVASYYSNRKGAAKRLEDDAAFNALSDAQKKKRLNAEGRKGMGLGALYGFRGGVRKGIGTAYNAGFDTQSFKANHLSAGETAWNYMRGALGAESRYEELIELDKIKTDAQNYRDSRQFMRNNQAVAKVKQDIDERYDSAIAANKEYEGAVNNTKDYIKKETSSEGNGIQRSVVVPKWVKNDDVSSNQRVVTGANAGKNISELRKESQNIDTQIDDKKKKIAELQAQRDASIASGGLRSNAARIDGEISTLTAEIASLGQAKIGINTDIDALSAIGGQMQYEVVSGLNRAQIDKIKTNLIEQLKKQGASEQEALDAYYNVTKGKDSAGNAFDFAAHGLNAAAKKDGTYYTKADGSCTVDSSDIFLISDAVKSIEKQFFDTGVNGATKDIKLSELLSEQEAKSQNREVGHEAGTRDARGNLQVGAVVYQVPDATRTSADAFYAHAKTIENLSSRLQAEKTTSFNNYDLAANGIEDWEVLADGTERLRDPSKPNEKRTINEILAENKAIEPRTEARNKAHESVVKANIGLKQASESAKKLSDVLPFPPPGGGKKK